MNANYDGEPIDMTYQHISERDGETVSGSSGESDGSEQTVFWPDVLPEDVFNDWERDALRRLSYHDDVGAVAEAVGKSEMSIKRTLQRVSIFAAPDEVPYPIPDEPTWSSLSYRDHPAARECVGSDEPNSQDLGPKIHQKALPDSEVDEIRQSLLDGEYTKTEFLRRHACDGGKIHDALSEILGSSEFGSETSPITWDNSAQQWVADSADSGGGADAGERAESLAPEKEAFSVRLPPSDAAEVHAMEEETGNSTADTLRRLIRDGLRDDVSATSTSTDDGLWIAALSGFLCGVFLSVFFGSGGGSQ